MVSPKKEEPKRGVVKAMSMDELPYIFLVVDVWHRRKNLGQGYVDGGAQICVKTHSCVEKMGLIVAGVSGFEIRLANHQKVKCLGIIKNLEVEAYDVKAMVNFHVMPAGLRAYAMILGSRPWLRAVGAVQDWRHGTISFWGKAGVKQLYDMNTRKPLGKVYEDEDDSTDEDSSTVSEVDNDSSTNCDEEVDVAFLLIDREPHESGLVALENEVEDESEGPYEVIEG